MKDELKMKELRLSDFTLINVLFFLWSFTGINRMCIFFKHGALRV